jgi:hypothetical protein
MDLMVDRLSAPKACFGGSKNLTMAKTEAVPKGLSTAAI